MEKVKLVGAGPGDPDLITVKGLKALWTAEVVLYDALVNKEILQHCPVSCRMIFVGKRAGMKRYTQVEINELMVHHAAQG
ncbi:MAG: uroporphyrinogen-III C-methyltransferase, partial [Flavobacteriales bacterium]|nr:uroporphyrinogen-III C-methyltransferase [Flavobacteriales bacterium]